MRLKNSVGRDLSKSASAEHPVWRRCVFCSGAIRENVCVHCHTAYARGSWSQRWITKWTERLETRPGLARLATYAVACLVLASETSQRNHEFQVLGCRSGHRHYLEIESRES